MAYCTYDEVGGLLGLIFTDTSKPTSSRVTGMITLIDSEINYAFKMMGLTTPLLGTDLYNVLKLQSMQGSAGLAALSLMGNADSVIDSQGEYFRKNYIAFITDIKENPNNYKNDIASMLVSNQVLDGTITEEELNNQSVGDDWIA